MTERFEIEGEEVLDGEVKSFENSAHVVVPKSWCGADVKIVRTSPSGTGSCYTEAPDDECSACGRERQDLPEGQELHLQVFSEFDNYERWICSFCRDSGLELL